MLRSVFTTFYRVRVWRCSSPWLSLYASYPLSVFFPLLTIKGAVEGSHLSSVLLYSRQKWDVSGPITALLTVTDDVCPSENTDKKLKTKPQTVSSSLLFQEIYWSHNGGNPWKYPTVHSVFGVILTCIAFLLEAKMLMGSNWIKTTSGQMLKLVMPH